MTGWTALPDLASRALGGSVVAASESTKFTACHSASPPGSASSRSAIASAPAG